MIWFKQSFSSGYLASNYIRITMVSIKLSPIRDVFNSKRYECLINYHESLTFKMKSFERLQSKNLKTSTLSITITYSAKHFNNFKRLYDILNFF